LIYKHFIGDIIFNQGELGDRLYIVSSGCCIAVKKNEAGIENIVKSYKSGDCFGEVALISNFVRKATMIAEEDTEAHSIERGVFER